MMIITLRNCENIVDDFCNYEYSIYMNKKKIATGKVFNHNRKNGWQGLVKKLAASVKNAIPFSNTTTQTENILISYFQDNKKKASPFI